MLLLCDGHRGEGSGGSALPDHGVTAGHGQGGVPTVHRHGEVEGSDDAWIVTVETRLTGDLPYQ